MKENKDWHLITVSLVLHLGAIGFGLGQKKVPHSRFKIKRVMKILKKHRIGNPLWFLINSSITKRRISQEYYHEKVMAILKIRKKDLELLVSLFKDLKTRKNHFIAISICTEIIKNVK